MMAGFSLGFGDLGAAIFGKPAYVLPTSLVEHGPALSRAASPTETHSW
jgi:hypothetical protein